MLTQEQVDAAFAWAIESRECYFKDSDGVEHTIPGKRTLVRTDRSFGLGIVTPSYGIVQPAAQMSLLHAAVGDGQVEYINGGVFENGKRMFLQAALKGGNFDVAGQEHGAYFMLGAHNDGTGAFWAAFTPTRLWCMNQLRFALKNLRNKFSIRHTKNATERLETVREVMVRARGFFGAYNEQAQALVRQRFTLQDMHTLAEELWPTPKAENLVPGIEATRARVIQLFDGGQLGAPALNGTKYGALNAVVEYVDHHQHRKGGESGRLNAVLFGSQANVLKQLAFDRIAA